MVVWRWFGVVWWWFGVNMADLRNIRNTNAFKFILQVFILSQKHIMGVNKVVWCGLGLTWQIYVIYVIQMLLNSFFKSSYYHKNILWVLIKWFGVV